MTIVICANGYPGNYVKNINLDAIKKIKLDNKDFIFHAGTKKDNGKVVTNGGRVIAVTSYGKDLNEALQQSYKNTKIINWDKKYFRSDLGFDLQEYLN